MGWKRSLETHADLAVYQRDGRVRVSDQRVRAVASALADFADHAGRPTGGGNIRPSHERLSRVTGIGVDQVQRACSRLVELGLLVKVTRRTAPGRAAVYQLSAPAPAAPDARSGSFPTPGARGAIARSGLRAIDETAGGGSGDARSVLPQRAEDAPTHLGVTRRETGGPEQTRMRLLSAVAPPPSPAEPQQHPDGGGGDALVWWGSLGHEDRVAVAAHALAQPDLRFLLLRLGPGRHDLPTASEIAELSPAPSWLPELMAGCQQSGEPE